MDSAYRSTWVVDRLRQACEHLVDYAEILIRKLDAEITRGKQLEARVEEMTTAARREGEQQRLAIAAGGGGR
jgi:hypothetical protein